MTKITSLILEWMKLVLQFIPKRFRTWPFNVSFEAGYSQCRSVIFCGLSRWSMSLQTVLWQSIVREMAGYSSVIYMPHSCGVSWYRRGVSQQPCLPWDTFALFPDTHSEAYFEIMATYVQENWAHEPTVWTFSRKKRKKGMYYGRHQGGVPLLFIQSLFMRTNTSNLLFPWMNKWTIVVNWIFWQNDTHCALHVDCKCFQYWKDNPFFNMIMQLNLIYCGR